MEIQIVPCNIEAEEAVLGSIIVDPDTLPEVQALINPEDFYREQNGWVYAAAIQIGHEGLNEITLAEQLKKDGKLSKAGGPAYLSGLVAQLPTSVHAKHYAQVVSDLAFNRRLITAGGQITAIAHAGEGKPMDLLTRAQDVLSGLDPQDEELVNPHGHAESMLKLIETAKDRQYTGIKSGYFDLDRMIGGFYPENLVIIGARPGMGKSQILQEIALYNANIGKKVLIATREMSVNEWDERHIQMETGIDIQRLRKGEFTREEWEDLLDTVGCVSEMPLYFLPGNFSVSSIVAKARQMHRTVGLDLVLVDYIQILSDKSDKKKGDTLRERIGYISQALKSIARECQCPVIAASQLNREVEHRESKRPTMADLRESGDLEQDADIILLLHRDEVYNPQTIEKGILDIGVAKTRQLGVTGVVKLLWRATHHRYANIAQQEESC